MIQPSTSLIHLIVIQNIQHGLKLEAHKSERKSCCPSSPKEVFTQFFFIGSDLDILFFSDTDPSNVKTWIRILIYGPKFIRINNIVIRPVIKIPDKNWPDLSPPPGPLLLNLSTKLYYNIHCTLKTRYSVVKKLFFTPPPPPPST